MKRNVPFLFRSLFLAGLIVLMGISARASHIVGADLYYKWISGNTYEITVKLYGDCGPSSSGAFSTLPMGSPHVCIYNGPTSVGSVDLNIVAPTAGEEITPVCDRDSSRTQCTSHAFTIPGIKQFTYVNRYTFSGPSHNWRLIYTGGNGTSGSAGRAAALTNILGGSSMQLIDTLDNFYYHNSSPVLTVVPTPFFCINDHDCYNPGAVDIYDTSRTNPSGDSLMFYLTAATRGSGGTSCTVGGACTYTGTAWTTPFVQAISPSTPLIVRDGTPSSFSFDRFTGQICFYPTALQRAVIVYNIREFRHDTFMGSMQREMSFNVLDCVNTSPTGDIDSFSGAGDTLNSNHFVACGSSSAFTLNFNPTEPDTSNNIWVTASGLPPGAIFTVDSNGTRRPHAHFTWTATPGVVAPGDYIFYVTYTDDNCPIVGNFTQAFTITVFPVPTIRDSMVSPATCTRKAAFFIIPGGTGKPWRIKISDIMGDTIQTFVDTTSFMDSLAPGTYWYKVYTDVSNQCGVVDSIKIDTPLILAPATFTNPTQCGSNDGTIIFSGLTPFDVDTAFYNFNTVLQPGVGFVVEPDGTDTLRGLYAGVYDNIRVKAGFCYSRPVGPLNLLNPPFRVRTLSFIPPTKCGYCDGEITLYGLNPGQLDTLEYLFGGVPKSAAGFIGPDSTMKITNLCEGDYDRFYVHTAAVCTTNILGLVSLRAPAVTAGFNFTIKEGCSGDTVYFNNTSSPLAELTFKWNFGDGKTDTATNPTHVYKNTKNMTYNVTLTITNGKCVDTLTLPVYLNNFIDAGFTIAPHPYVCQGSPVTFTDTSTGTSPSFQWFFGDGGFDNNFNTTHTYKNKGTYNITLIAGNSVPCFDTAYGQITVDSISPIKIVATDTVLCRGQEVTFTGLFTTIGKTEVTWDFGDGSKMKNVNPVLHSFDNTGTLTITADVLYRSCPALSSSKTIHVIPVPDIYLGEDKAICPGGAPIKFNDDRNASNPVARWKWSTGETTPGIIVAKPGYYSAVVNVNGCINSDTVWVANDCYLSMPNIFTPNGDGVNDFFFPRQLLTRGLTSFTMSIYNRWGQLIYEANSIDGQGWDGSLNNTPQPQGVYIYKIDVKFKDGQIEHYQGNITLLR